MSEYVAASNVSGWANLSSVIGSLKSKPELRWANPLDLKNAAEKVFTNLFGEKTAIKAKAQARFCVSMYFCGMTD